MSPRRKECHGADGNVLVDGYIQRGSFCALKEGLRVGLALVKGNSRPQSAMLKDGSAPMATYEGDAKSFLREELFGDEREDIQRDTVDGCKRVPPFTDRCQCGRSVPVELRNGIQREAAEEVSSPFLINLFSTHDGE